MNRITKCPNKYAGKCQGGHCGIAVAPYEGVYIKRRLVCQGCLQNFADQVATNKSAKTVMRGNLTPINRTGIPTGLLYWLIRANGIKGADRLRHREVAI